MPGRGSPTADLTTEMTECQASARPAAGLVDQHYAPALGLASKIAEARRNLCACRGHLRTAAGTQSLPELIGDLDGLIGLSETIIALDQEMGGSLAAVAHNRRAQVVNALGDLAEKLEEIRSSEDVTLAEIVADALSFGLNRIGDYSYVLSARAAARGQLEKLRPVVEQELMGLLEQKCSGEHGASAIAFCDALFSPRRRPEELGPMALLVLAAIFRARCAVFVQRLDALVEEKHSALGK